MLPDGLLPPSPLFFRLKGLNDRVNILKLVEIPETGQSLSDPLLDDVSRRLKTRDFLRGDSSLKPAFFSAWKSDLHLQASFCPWPLREARSCEVELWPAPPAFSPGVSSLTIASSSRPSLESVPNSNELTDGSFYATRSSFLKSDIAYRSHLHGPVRGKQARCVCVCGTAVGASASAWVGDTVAFPTWVSTSVSLSAANCPCRALISSFFRFSASSVAAFFCAWYGN